MTPEKWRKVKIILEDALEMPNAERTEFLEKSCNGDAELREEMEKLLAFETSDDDLLENNAFSVVSENGNNFVGKKIGNYEIIEEIGAGGMGAVYLATRADGEFEQKAALKLIKRGMDSDAILKRFYNERQILASLEHPNIARLLDGGTTDDGLPYFVMEFVEGDTIIEYAARENLDLEARLNLFRKVCAAVSFAHQNLVIHRDLKPSNILVGAGGEVKLLDFGIAKLLRTDENNLKTRTQLQVFTPEYASPEQILGENLTTASDVYSLGVILYELLTGNRPHKTESKNISEIIKSVCETEPVRPSSVFITPWSVKKDNGTNENKGQRTKDEGQQTNPKSKIQNLKSLKGDLDNIILKSLRKEPERRYASVEQFSEDIRRHLVGLPVSASRDTWNYRTSKFVQRNRFAVVAGGLIFSILIAGLAATFYQMNEARRERAKAERRFNDVRRLANSFMFEINEQIVKSPIKARELLVERAVEYLDSLASEAENDTELQSELATAYEKIGNVQAEIFKPNLGKTSDAINSHRKALQIREKLFAAEPDATRGLAVANSRILIGDILMTANGRLAEARENYLASIKILESLIASGADDFAVRRKLGSNYAVLGQNILRSGSLNAALANYEKSLEIFQNLRAENPNDSSLERSVGIVFSFIAFVKMETGKADEAADFYGKWLETEKKLSSADETDIKSRGHLATAHTWFGIALNEQGKTDEAIENLTAGVKIQEEIFKADEKNFGERNALADANLELGKILLKNNKTEEAIKTLEQATAHYETILQTDRENLWNKHRVAAAQRFLADAFANKGDFKKASELYSQTLEAMRDLTAADPNSSEWQLELAMNYLKIGELNLKIKDKTAALADFEKSLPMFENLAKQSPENIKRKRDLEINRSHIAAIADHRRAFLLIGNN